MRITDQGLSFNNKLREDVDMEFSVEELRRIVPGTLKSKSGKLLRVALIVSAAYNYNIITSRRITRAEYLGSAVMQRGGILLHSSCSAA